VRMLVAGMKPLCVGYVLHDWFSCSHYWKLTLKPVLSGIPA